MSSISQQVRCAPNVTTRRLTVINLALRGIEADQAHCMVALPGQLFSSTKILVCFWFILKNPNADIQRGFRDCRQQILFIDFRKLGTLVARVSFACLNN